MVVLLRDLDHERLRLVAVARREHELGLPDAVRWIEEERRVGRPVVARRGRKGLVGEEGEGRAQLDARERRGCARRSCRSNRRGRARRTERRA